MYTSYDCVKKIKTFFLDFRALLLVLLRCILLLFILIRPWCQEDFVFTCLAWLSASISSPCSLPPGHVLSSGSPDLQPSSDPLEALRFQAPDVPSRLHTCSHFPQHPCVQISALFLRSAVSTSVLLCCTWFDFKLLLPVTLWPKVCTCLSAPFPACL